MDFVNLEVNNFNERNKLNSELSSLNMQKADQIELLVLMNEINLMKK